MMGQNGYGVRGLKGLMAAFFLLGGLVSAAVGSAVAQDKLLGRFKDWDAVQAVIGGETVCYISSSPKKAGSSGIPRKQIAVIVAHWPKRKLFGQVKVALGHMAKAKSRVVFNVDGRAFWLWTSKSDAWARSAAHDRQLIWAMRRGRSLAVVSTPAQGKKVRDDFSLSGFSAALVAIGKACRGGRGR